jgi:endoglucanase
MVKRIVLFFTFSILIFSGVYASNTDIRLNSLGFLSTSQKKASIKADSVSAFYVKSSPSGDLIYTGTATDFGMNSDTSEHIWIADFSSVTASGNYYLDVPGVGQSFVFPIGDDVYNFAFYTVFRGFYLWRCGTAVSGMHNGYTYSHAACHMNDAYLDYVGGGHTIRDGKGGWHDAGDYNKYVVNAGVTVGVLGMAWLHFKDKISTIDINLPDTASGYPDFLKEIKWETDWLLKTAYSDGSGKVSHKVSAINFCGTIMPEAETTSRYFTDWGSAATADFVAMLAMASRLFRPYDETYANTCLNAALNSYWFLYNNPANKSPDQSAFKTGTYNTDDTDDRLWAAAEIWEATGNTIAHQDFISRANVYSNKINWSMDWGNVENLGMFTYYMSTRTGKNSAIIDDIRNDTIQTANSYAGSMSSHGYGRVLGTSYWWGINGTLARAALTLYMANIMSPNMNYINAIQAIVDHLFGRNYYCRSWVTGLGNNPPLYPHDRRSGADGIIPPWPGYLVGGPQPNATSWIDSADDYTTNEIAINWNSALVYALGAMLNQIPTPTATITGTPPTQTVTPTLTMTPTITLTPTEVYSYIKLNDVFVYPNPTKGDVIKFLVNTTGFSDAIRIRIFTYSDRKIADFTKNNYPSGKNTIEYNPDKNISNGLYYYVVEVTGRSKETIKRTGV